jgi:LuxR family maltose regulon positive regulatory protein
VITEPAVHGIVDYLLDHAPVNLRVILATRHDPPMSLARRRARGEVGEIRLDDLSFTEQEAGELASKCLGLALSAEEVRSLHSRTEGWAAGLRLLATSLSQSPSSRNTLLQSGGMQGSRRIFDFLAEEVLDRQTPDLRSFLLDTSILTRLNPEVCDALTGRDDSLHVLEDLYHRNLYVVAADESESSFRYHDLFADFLRERLRRERPADWQALHIRAAKAEPSPNDRMRHLLAAKAWEEAAAEIERIGPEYTMRGFVATLRRWIGELPETVQEQHPRVLYLLGQAVWILSEFIAAQPYIEKALDAFRKSNDHAGQAEATIALANSALMTNELDKCRELLKEALTFDIPAAGRIQLETASAWEATYRKDLSGAVKHTDQVLAMVESGEGRTSPLALITVLYAEGLPGYCNKIEATCRVIGNQLSSPPDFSHAIYHVINSAILIHRGDIATGDTEAKRSMSIAQNCGQVSVIQVALHINFCLVDAARGDWDSVDRWSTLACDESRYGLVSRAWKLHFLYFQARARWHSGNIEGLRQTYEAAMTPNPIEAPPVSVYRHLIRGMMHMAERAYAQAEHSLRDAVRDEDGFPMTRSTCSARLMLAYCLLTRGRADEAMEVFSPYLTESEGDNVPGRLMYENPMAQPLLRQAHERNIQRPFVEKVLALMGAPLNAMEAAGGEALSDREMEVLRVMADGLGNREIGERLFVSEATVKTHVQRILRKLDAASRTQAVARARELMLI